MSFPRIGVGSLCADEQRPLLFTTLSLAFTYYRNSWTLSPR